MSGNNLKTFVNIQYVQQNLDERTKLEQLAEECNELAKAALKLIRAKGISGNPTPISVAQAEADLKEEAMDVLACLLVCGYNIETLHDEVVCGNDKWARWVKRIEEMECGTVDGEHCVRCGEQVLDYMNYCPGCGKKVGKRRCKQ